MEEARRSSLSDLDVPKAIALLSMYGIQAVPVYEQRLKILAGASIELTDDGLAVENPVISIFGDEQGFIAQMMDADSDENEPIQHQRSKTLRGAVQFICSAYWRLDRRSQY